MKLKHLFSVIAAMGVMQSASAQFNVTTHRMLVSSGTTYAMSSSYVNGSSGGTDTSVDMYYDSTDGTAGYPSTQNLWNKTWSGYLSGSSALGIYGALGYAGPLSSLGPLGAFSVTSLSGFYLAFIPTSIWQGNINFGTSPSGGPFGTTGPYGYAGPLGSGGPITEVALYDTMYHLNENNGCSDAKDQACDDNDFPHQLDPAGVWGVLGPGSLLGALGPLGPLGRLGWGAATYGADTNCRDATGNYYIFTASSSTAGTCSGTIARSLVVPYTNGGTTDRKFDLVELYDRASLISQQGNPSTFTNDTSFSVDAATPYGNTNWTTSNHTYYFRSAYDQFVSILPVPVNGYADIDADIEIRRDTGVTFSSASSVTTAWSALSAGHTFSLNSGAMVGWPYGYQDYAVVRAKANDIFKVVVKRYSAYNGYNDYGYYLHVVGTGSQYRVSGGAWQDSTLFQNRRTTGGYPTFNIVGPHQSNLGAF